MRSTSEAAYQSIRESGILSEKRAEALDVLRKFEPATAGELKRDSGVDGLWKRLGELRDMNLARELPERKCQVTKQSVIVWETTDLSNPVPFKKAPEVVKPVFQLFEWLINEHNALPKGDPGKKVLKSVHRKAKELGVI